MTPYERLQAWDSAHQMVLRVYGATESWPSRERYGLTSQIRRAAFSVAANIAEGSAKKGAREPWTSGKSSSPLVDLAGKLVWKLYKAMNRTRP